MFLFDDKLRVSTVTESEKSILTNLLERGIPKLRIYWQMEKQMDAGQLSKEAAAIGLQLLFSTLFETLDKSIGLMECEFMLPHELMSLSASDENEWAVVAMKQTCLAYAKAVADTYEECETQLRLTSNERIVEVDRYKAYGYLLWPNLDHRHITLARLQSASAQELPTFAGLAWEHVRKQMRDEAEPDLGDDLLPQPQPLGRTSLGHIHRINMIIYRGLLRS